ncbi:dynein regulatory complex protein [Pimephales promelas]|nr:dynein regulatory complex protein [Pimephales promelas]
MMSSKLDDLPLEERLSDAASIPNKTKADLLKIINPTRKTLSSWESKLILGVLDECINQMEIASLLRTLLNCPEALSPSLGKEVVSALKEHHRLEEKYQAMVLDVSLEQKEQLAKSAKAIQDSFRNIVRLIRGTQTTREVLKPIEPNTGGEMGLQNLKDGLCKFREVVLERLLRTPTEEREHGEMILKVSLRHSANQAVMDSLDKEIAMAIKAKETEISMLNNKVQQLRSSLHQMEKSLEESVVRTQQDAEKQSQSEKKTSEGKRARMQQEANQLRAQLNNVISENRESEMKLRKVCTLGAHPVNEKGSIRIVIILMLLIHDLQKKYKEETEIENLIQKYDAEMGEKQVDINDLAFTDV